MLSMLTPFLLQPVPFAPIVPYTIPYCLCTRPWTTPCKTRQDGHRPLSFKQCPETRGRQAHHRRIFKLLLMRLASLRFLGVAALPLQAPMMVPLDIQLPPSQSPEQAQLRLVAFRFHDRRQQSLVANPERAIDPQHLVQMTSKL